MREVLLNVVISAKVRERIERRVKIWAVPLPHLLTVALDRLEEDVRHGRVDLSILRDGSISRRRGRHAQA